MSALFKVTATFGIGLSPPRRPLSVITGDVVEGQVRIGMVAQLLSGAEVLFSESIHGVEFVRNVRLERCEREKLPRFLKR